MIRRNIAIWYVSVATYGFATGFLYWFIPIILAKISYLLLALVFSVCGLSGTLLPMVGGALADILGRKKIIIIQSGLVELGIIIIYFALQRSDVVMLACGFIIFRSGGYLGLPVATALYDESCDPERLGTISSIAGTIRTSCIIVSSVSSGILLPIIRVHGVLLVVITLYFFGFLSKFFLVETLEHKHRVESHIHRKFVETMKIVISDRDLVRYTFLLALLTLFDWFIILLPVVLEKEYGFSLSLVAFYYAIYVFLSGVPSPIGGVAVDRLGIKKALLISITMDTSLLIAFFLIVGLDPIVGFLILVFAGSVTWFEGAVHTVLPYRITSRETRGSVYGFWTSLYWATSIAMPWIMYAFWGISSLLAIVVPTIVNIIVNIMIIIWFGNIPSKDL